MFKQALIIAMKPIPLFMKTIVPTLKTYTLILHTNYCFNTNSYCMEFKAIR